MTSFQTSAARCSTTHNFAEREPITSTRRSGVTWGNGGPHSGSWWFHGKDGVAGSIPAGGSTTNQQLRPGPAPGLSQARRAKDRRWAAVGQQTTLSEPIHHCMWQQEVARPHPSLPAGQTSSTPRCSALLGRFRVERRAEGLASSVMASPVAGSGADVRGGAELKQRDPAAAWDRVLRRATDAAVADRLA
jgi:hypothetical protein